VDEATIRDSPDVHARNARTPEQSALETDFLKRIYENLELAEGTNANLHGLRFGSESFARPLDRQERDKRVKGIEPSSCDAPRQRIRLGRGKDDCKQPKTEAYMCEKMCDFSSFSSERAN
jgi:hypothetical protein